MAGSGYRADDGLSCGLSGQDDMAGQVSGPRWELQAAVVCAVKQTGLGEGAAEEGQTAQRDGPGLATNPSAWAGQSRREEYMLGMHTRPGPMTASTRELRRQLGGQRWGRVNGTAGGLELQTTGGRSTGACSVFGFPWTWLGQLSRRVEEVRSRRARESS